MFPESNDRCRFIAGVCARPVAVDEAIIFPGKEQIAAPFIPPARECLVPLTHAYRFEKDRFHNRAEKNDQPIPIKCRQPGPKPARDGRSTETGSRLAGLAGVPAGRAVWGAVRSE
jgi:hypothetical protein